jgi:hypothetical protein
MAVILQVIDHAAPIKPGATVIAIECVRQINFGMDQSIRNRGLGWWLIKAGGYSEDKKKKK